MPPVLIPVALTAAAGAAGVALGVTTVTAVALSVGVTAVAAGVGYLTAPQANETAATDTSSATSITTAPVNAQRDIAVRQAVPPRRYVYGSCRIGGVIFFQDNNNPYLYIGVAISDGVIEAVDSVWFADNLIELDSSGAAAVGSIYYGALNVEVTDGDSDEAASTTLLTAFSTLDSTFRQRGVARAVCKLYYGDDAAEHSALWGDSVSPSFSVRGVRMYDPRDIYSVETDEGTWSYSANPALAVAHALTHAWGVALDSTDIDWDSFGDCADLCDATITYNAASVATYEIAGVFQAGSELASQITDMLASFGGVLIDVSGKIGCRMDESRSSVWTITDDDIIEFGEFAHAGAYENTYNAIKARFFDADSDGAEDTTPVYEMTYEQALEGLRETAIDLRFAAKTHSAQILAYKELMRSRAGKRLSLTLSDAGMYLQALDRVTISSTDASFINGDYEVLQVDLAQFGVIVQMREYPTDAYASPSTYLV